MPSSSAVRSTSSWPSLKPGRIYGRCNWFVSPTNSLRWLAKGSPEEQFAHVTPENAGETLFIRSERQTLRKLPETEAIVFTIGIYLAPLGSLSRENIARMAESLSKIPNPKPGAAARLLSHPSCRPMPPATERLSAQRHDQEPRMKILVPVKRVIDYNVRPRVKPDGSGSTLPTSR